MFKDQKDEMIVMLKRKNQELTEQLNLLVKQCEEYKKGDSAAETKIKALNEVNAQKVKTLLKSIQNLKKEVQKERFEKKDNVRVKIIEGLKKEHEDFELAVNALRKLVNNEDKCDLAIKNELQRGPKRIRIASREEMKMEIKKYKNMALRLLEILKQNGVQLPTGSFKIDMNAGEGIREDKGDRIFDINQLSEGKSGGASLNDDLAGIENADPNEDLGGYQAQDLLEAKDRLEDQLVKLNMELKDKNERLLELLEEQEDLRIQIYARDKSVALQQKQMEELLEELRESKAIENDVKILVQRKMALEEDNLRLRKQIESKFMNTHENQFAQNDLALENKTLTDQLRALQQQLQERAQETATVRKRLEAEKTQLSTELEGLRKEHDTGKKELLQLQSSTANLQGKLSSSSGQAKDVLSQKDQEIEGFRSRVIEVERELKKKDERMAQLEAKVVELSTEVADKDYEIEFYSNQIEELQNENMLLKSGGSSATLAQGGATTQPLPPGLEELRTEIENWKKKCKVFQQNEIKYLEEIETLKAQKQQEDRNRAVNTLVNKTNNVPSKPKTRAQQIADADGIE